MCEFLKMITTEVRFARKTFDLRQHAAEIIHCKKEKMQPLTNKKANHTANQNFVMHSKRIWC